MFKVVNPDSSIYVQLSINGQPRVQEFAPGDERAYVVGTTDRASLRVNGIGIAPVQFHLEREDGAIWLIPAYGIADLSVDGIHVFGPTALSASSAIEFCGVRIGATLVEADRLARDDDRLSVPRLETQASRESYSSSLLGDEEPTIVAVRPVPSEPVAYPIHEAPTRPGRPNTHLVPPVAPRPATETVSADGRRSQLVARHGSAVGRRITPLPEADSSTKRLLVIGGAAVGALVIALAIFVVAHLVQRHRSQPSPALPSMIDDRPR